MSGFLIFLSFVALLAGAVVLVKPIPKLGLKTRWYAPGLFFVSLVSCTMGVGGQGAVDPAATQKTSGPPSIRGADPSIESVEISPPNIIIQAYIDKPLSDRLSVHQAGQIAEKVGKALQKGVSEDGKEIEYVLLSYEVAGLDRLGNDTRIDFINIVLPAEDLRNANYKNLSTFDVMNLAHEVSFGGHVGAQALAAWCKANLDVGLEFCKKAIR